MLGGAAIQARAQESLARLLEPAHGAALLVDVKTRRLVATHGSELARGLPAPPGSTLKPLTLTALIEAGKLGTGEAFPCPGALEIGGRSFACSHPPIGAAMRIRTALAYSCNCFVAHFAERFAPGELAAGLSRWGLASRTGWFGDAEVSGWIEVASGVEPTRLQAIGEGGVRVTAAALAAAYRSLALSASRPAMAPILGGLEDAVEFGTAQRARIAGVTVAGKTGSVRTAEGAFIAWFAGFAPSRAPQVVVAVMLQGRSGGADAAPIAGRILEAHFGGRR